jgi:hypothetical protein
VNRRVERRQQQQYSRLECKTSRAVMLESASSKPFIFRTYLRHNNITCVISLFSLNCWEVVQLAGLQILNLAILVRVQASQPNFKKPQFSQQN